jgi:aryl-alcohol dehydrogenase-like predicted oxidoreductase
MKRVPERPAGYGTHYARRMEQRTLMTRTPPRADGSPEAPVEVGAVGFGAWQIGAAWGEVTEDEANAALEAAVASGVTFFDTADVYGDGRSEVLVGALRRRHPEITVATKMGRRVEQLPENYSPEHFRAWNDASRANLGVETLDLVQLHCPPTPVYHADAVFDDLDAMVAEGRMRAYGVSVETCEQALAAIGRPHVASVQIILNPFRQKPLEAVLPAAEKAGVGVIARVPLASGLLSGRYDAGTRFAEDDHRNFNRNGEAFDVGETFAGVDYETGLAAVERLRSLVPEGMTMAQFALRWILDQRGVSVVIPGARNAAQAEANAAAADFPPLPEEVHAEVAAVYDELIRPQVHHRW